MPAVATDLRLTVPRASVVRLDRTRVPPAAELNRVAPLVFAVSAKVPSTVPVNVMLPLRVDTVVSPSRSVVPTTLNAESVVA